jgi:hypothetical protein
LPDAFDPESLEQGDHGVGAVVVQVRGEVAKLI